ncbi:MAG: glycosyl transferase family 2 [Elusimicrobia bacterium CG_4_9_14_3_um_filter_62_55]|nr:MAG: glycosyl transferase family 2 [Elusimicrobia bacterium CG22_combo_CG10-13_8_21_14_all_63_91]PJB24396.1 MAG: glycosyl transferase family 2 [Elusimicrobia bacterium CG_4_9_14_3_um_filter_62_55]
MSANPRVSVLINAYNGAAFLREAIESVYAQTFSDFEIVLYDDASTDDTPNIAKSFDDKLRYFRSERQVPLGEARNNALEFCRGEFISFLDQDDLYLPEKLARQVAAFSEGVGLVFSNSLRFWEADGREDLFYKSRPPDGDAFRQLLRAYYLPIHTVMIRRSALPSDRTWWFPEHFKMCEESDLFLRIAYKYRIAYVDEILAKYRVHGNNYSLTNREDLIKEPLEIIDRLSKLHPEFQEEYAEEIRAYRADIKREEARGHWRRGNRYRTWRCYYESLRLNPRPVFLAELFLSFFLPYRAFPAIRSGVGRPL